MKITIDCVGRDNDALVDATDQQLQYWLIGKASEHAKEHGTVEGAIIRDINGNLAATITVEEE